MLSECDPSEGACRFDAGVAKWRAVLVCKARDALATIGRRDEPPAAEGRNVQATSREDDDLNTADNIFDRLLLPVLRQKQVRWEQVKG